MRNTVRGAAKAAGDSLESAVNPKSVRLRREAGRVTTPGAAEDGKHDPAKAPGQMPARRIREWQET